jgi:hypothetical protein
MSTVARSRSRSRALSRKLFRSITPTLLETESDVEGDRDEGKAPIGGGQIIDITDFDESQDQVPVPHPKVETPVVVAAAPAETTTTSHSDTGNGEVTSGSVGSGGPSRAWKKLGGPPRPRKGSGDREVEGGKNGDLGTGGKDKCKDVPSSTPAASSGNLMITSVVPPPPAPLPRYEHKVGEWFRIAHFQWPRVEYKWDSQPTFPLNEF